MNCSLILICNVEAYIIKSETLQRKCCSRADHDTLSLGANLARMRTRANTL